VITAKNITIRYSGTDILTDVSFKIDNGKEIGLVGRNGCGKSTLFKLINGVEEPTSGNIELQNEVLGYIPQEFSFPDQMAGEYLENLLETKNDFYRIEVLAAKLKFHNFDPYQKINTMSEGQKMKIKLIEILLEDPTTLFIDEPTNHLDIEGIMWFEDYIKSLPITVVMISHDRSFLNHTVDEIWEIEKCKILRFVGDYDNYRTEKLKLINKWDQDYVLFLKKKAQMETLLENVRKIKDGKARGRAVEAAKKRIDREVVQNTKEKYVVKKVRDMDFKTDVHDGKLMVRFNSVSKSYGDKKVFDKLSFELRGKEKVWLYGPNGAGKTTLVKIIMGLEDATDGTVKIGESISIGYFSQVQTELDSKEELLEEFIAKTGCYFGQAFGYLEKFLFDKESVKKRVWQLSPGERARFTFAIFAYKNYDLLVLDEPDNHLDIDTKEVIEKSLREFKGALLLVSHDRYFVESVGVSKVLNLREGSLSFFESFS
jgi:ATP-binding cassette subfamily F protein 3